MDDLPPQPPADPQLTEVYRRLKSGDLAGASSRGEQLLAARPDDVQVLFILGRVAMEQYRWEDAIGLFDRMARLKPDPWCVGNLGVCHWKLGHLDEAQYCLNGAVEMAPDYARARVHLAGVLHALNRFDEALAQLDVAAQLDAADHQVAMRRGCALAALGRFDEAQQEFSESGRMAGKFTYQRLVAFDRPAFERVTTAEERVAPPVSALARANDGPSVYVTLISCNPPYVRKYGVPFIRSYAEHAQPGTLLHLHVYDPDDRIVAEVGELMRACAVPRYAVTTEASPFPAQNVQQRKAFYACGRLIHLPFWLEQYRCPVLSLDVDFIVEKDLKGLVAAAAVADVGLNPRNPVDSPWLDIIANIIIAKPVPAALRYFSAVKNYALEYLRREPEAWLVDQTALYCVLKMMERFGTAPAVAWIPAETQRCLWHIGHAYDHLLTDPRFKKYAG